jgi:hypothetical protein
VRSGLEATIPELVSEKIAGKEYWTTGDAQSHAPRDGSSVHLLPAFDEYLLGYKDRGAVLAVEDAQKIVPGMNGVFLPTIAVGGRVVGTWKRKLKKNSVDITLSPFAHLDGLDERATDAARSYSDFVGLPLS